MNYYISDLHWGEESVIDYDSRPFFNAEECFRYMKRKWNEIVQKEDHVYIIGDCIFENADDVSYYLSGLNGHLHLVVGNNDYNLIQNQMIKNYFEDVSTILKVVDNDVKIIMCHYPIACWEDKDKANCVHIYGHMHKNGEEEYFFMNKLGKAFNAGCMINNYTPVTLEQLVLNNKIYYEKK